MGRTFQLSFSRRLAPGDHVVLSAMVRDLKLTYPDCRIFVSETYGHIWQENPHATMANKNSTMRENTERIIIGYGDGIQREKYETVHFLAWLHRDFNRQTGLEVPVLYPRGDLHLTNKEREPLVSGRYWVVLSGGKADMPVKVWPQEHFQAVVDGLRAFGVGVVQAGASEDDHKHPSLNGALDLVGGTDLRQFIQLIAGADGVVCGVTMAMHVAAALERPCVVLGGGRESWWWEAYVNENRGFGPYASHTIKVPHRFLHSIGKLGCCESHGCWKRFLTLSPGLESSHMCYRPLHTKFGYAAECLNMIAPERVLEACFSYYLDGTLGAI